MVRRRSHPARDPQRTGVNLLDVTPVREAEWREVDGRIVLDRPRPDGGGLRGLGDRLAFAMAARRLRLDEMGSCSWRCFDGATTVREACAVLRDRFGSSAEPTEERLGRFVRVLHREGFLSYREE